MNKAKLLDAFEFRFGGQKVMRDSSKCAKNVIKRGFQDFGEITKNGKVEKCDHLFDPENKKKRPNIAASTH